MGVLERVRNIFVNETETASNEETTGVADTTWKPCDQSTIMWQIQYALSVVANIMATFFINVDWKTYRRGKAYKGEEWFKFNYAPNRKETSAEFFDKLAKKFVYDGCALIIETATKELFIADSFTFKNGQELLMKDNTFTNVVIGNVTLNRSFKENDSCMFIKTPHYDQVVDVFEMMGADFRELKQMIYEGAQKALGMKLVLSMQGQNKNKFDAKAIANLQKTYEPLMRARDAVFLTFTGETLEDLTERQRGSEVQQVLEAVENNIKVNDSILISIGAAFGIPAKFMTGDFTADNDSIYSMAITMFGKPYLTLLSKKFSFFMLTPEDIINGSKIEADLNTIKFIETLQIASSIDKLIGSGAYTINEVREIIGDDPVEDGDTRFITKNYAVLQQYVKSGGDST